MAQARLLLRGIANVDAARHSDRTMSGLRDSGPTFLVGPASRCSALIDWGYNAWGGKYPPATSTTRSADASPDCWVAVATSRA